MAFLIGDGEELRVRGRARSRGASGRAAMENSQNRAATRCRPASNGTSQTAGAADVRHARDPRRPTPGTTDGRKRQVTGTHLVCLNVPIAVARRVALPIHACVKNKEWGQSARAEFPEPRLARARGAFSARRPRRCTRQHRRVRGQQLFVRCARSGEYPRRPGVLETNLPPVRDRQLAESHGRTPDSESRVLVCS